MFHKYFVAATLIVATAGTAAAQPYPYPYPPFPFPSPVPHRPQSSPVDGVWFFKGDRSKPCYIQTVPGPRGPQLVLTNENGTQSGGRLLAGGRALAAYDWNGQTAEVRGNLILWPGGGFWTR